MNRTPPKIIWPNGKRFAFTVVDDTDCARVGNVAPIYRLLLEHGIVTTKTVWPLAPVETPITGGDTLEESGYRAWVLDLQEAGVEIAYHGATDHTSPRQRSIKGLDLFRQILGQDPKIYASHVGQREAMYWGRARLDGLPKGLFAAMNKLAGRNDTFYGENEQSELYWGDICHDRIQYTRGFIFQKTNTLAADPIMPYHDLRRPYVRQWFSSSDGARLSDFKSLISEENQDRLLDEGGACVVYTHFGNGFCNSQAVDAEFSRLIRRLGALPGWFVPAAQLLDWLGRNRPQGAQPVQAALKGMQWQWLMQNLALSKLPRLCKRVWRSWAG
jgi:hypothetical protein